MSPILQGEVWGPHAFNLSKYLIYTLQQIVAIKSMCSQWGAVVKVLFSQRWP